MKNLTAAAKKFLARNPSQIGIVCDVRFYEHPTLGDEAPLVAITRSGSLVKTGHYELPRLEEVLEDLELMS